MFSGVLISSEGGYLHCWSLYGERKDMGMFFGPSEQGESILAMCTDSKNKYLICGDTRGELRIWNIENYCCSVVSPVPFDSQSPPLFQSWQAHISPIIFCEWTDYKGHGSFILTASTDHTARLWTINGEEIGIFGQREQWDIELLLSSRENNENYQKNETDENNTIIEQNIDKTNHLTIPDITICNNEQDKRPLSTSAIQYPDVDFQISSQTNLFFLYLRYVNQLDRQHQSQTIQHYYR